MKKKRRDTNLVKVDNPDDGELFNLELGGDDNTLVGADNPDDVQLYAVREKEERSKKRKK